MIVFDTNLYDGPHKEIVVGRPNGPNEGKFLSPAKGHNWMLKGSLNGIEMYSIHGFSGRDITSK